MGDRGNVVLNYGEGQEIFLYTHWGRSDIPDDLQTALEEGESRWHDPSYLARVIFEAMIYEAGGITGFGLSPTIGDGDRTATVFLEENLVKIGYSVYTYEDYLEIDDPKSLLDDE